MSIKPKIIPAEETDVFSDWNMPDIHGSAKSIVQDAYNKSGPITASQLQQLRDDAMREGHDQGYKEGFRKGEQDAAKKHDAVISHLMSIIQALSAPLAAVDNKVEESLAQLAMSVGKHIIRRELKIDPSQVIAVIREAVSLLPISSPNVQIYLHPDDAELIKDTLSVNATDSQWKIIEDPGLTRGGCRVVDNMSQVDATVETRLAAVIAQIMGDERES